MRSKLVTPSLNSEKLAAEMKYRKKPIADNNTNLKPLKIVYARKQQYLIQSSVVEQQVAKISVGQNRTGFFLKSTRGFPRAVGFVSPLVSL